MIPEKNRALKIFSALVITAQVLFLIAFGGTELSPGDDQEWLNLLLAPLILVFPNGLCFALRAMVGSTWAMLLSLAALDVIVILTLRRAAAWSLRRQIILMVTLTLLGPLAYGLSVGWAMWSFVEWGAKQQQMIECARSGTCDPAS